MAYNLGYDYNSYRPGLSHKIRKIIPFSSDRKKMSVVYEHSESKANFKLFTKGAPEIILDKCAYFINKNGQANLINLEFRRKLNEIIKSYANKSLRTLLIVYKDLVLTSKPTHPDQFPSDEELERQFTIIALAGIKDPLRDGIKESIQLCNEAGVTVRMVTGDNLDTAVAISKECGILPPDYQHNNDSLMVLEGKVFRELVGNL